MYSARQRLYLDYIGEEGQYQYRPGQDSGVRGGEEVGKKKKKASKTMRTPKKPFLQNITLNGEAILLQTQAFAREFQKQTERLIDG